MQYSAINIQGNILSSDILEKIRIEDIRFQGNADFNLEKAVSVRDEIGLAWSAVRAHWQAFSIRRNRLKDSDTGTTETRQSWVIPFLQELGYELEKSKAEVIDGRSYAISHRAVNRDQFPVHIQGINQSLDKRAETGGARLSPHALVQEYLNHNENLYALVTNGRFLRLLRDATRLSRLSYLEFDLERMMEEELFSEFALLFRALHVSRMPVRQGEGESSILEYYHQEALASGSRIRERLSGAVEESLKLLANGLLHHRSNEALRQRLEDQELSAADYYLYLLRLVYRILFLLVIEERNLIYPAARDEALAKKRNIYYRFYSVGRLTRLVQKSIYVNPRKTDLWQSLLVTFRIFESDAVGKTFGIQPLGSGLFSPSSLGDLVNQHLDNETVLTVLKYLVTFENENGHLSRVNYADLDVEEFGSVYEGLLEYDPKVEQVNHRWVFSFVKGTGRSSSGSHYTPEELVKPLIQHSLDYIIKDCIQAPEKRLKLTRPLTKMQAQEEALLSIRVADVACGSGHILLSAARRIALELARVCTREDQPTPTAIREATRDVIRTCIYGVDLNPLAVELCKVALWLEAHSPGQPLNFLDHHIKCGNAIVGLAHKNELEKGIPNEAFKRLPGDNKEIAAAWLKRNREERKQHESRNTKDAEQLTTDYNEKIKEEHQKALDAFDRLITLPEQTPKEIETKRKAYQQWLGSQGYLFLKTMADLQTAQFFYPKTDEYQQYLTTDLEYRQMLGGRKGWTGPMTAKATAEGAHRHFFHWFLEFPEVFEKGGFDCILGNPPFLGGQKLTGTFGHAFAEYIRYKFTPIGSVDLVTYFFRRIFQIIKEGGFQSLISTNTIAQGDARVGGLLEISKNSGVINHGVKSMRWPGLAAVEVALVTIFKGDWNGKYILDQNEVEQITSYLDDSENLGTPLYLKENENKSFQGSIILGKGFILDEDIVKFMIDKNEEYDQVIYPYLIGRDVNSNPSQLASRWVVSFKDWPLNRYSIQEWEGLENDFKKSILTKIKNDKVVVSAPPNYKGPVAKDFPDIIELLEKKVRPIREKDNREVYRKYWWQHAEKRPMLYKLLENRSSVIVSCRVSKYVMHSKLDSKQVIDVANTIILRDSIEELAVLQSSLHTEWAWKNASTMKGDIRYTNKDCVDTFPFPSKQDSRLIDLSNELNEVRKTLANDLSVGITTLMNLFHEQRLPKKPKITSKKVFTQMYGVASWKLFDILSTFEQSEIKYYETVLKIFDLRKLQTLLDEAVLTAYDWHKDSEKWGPAIDLAHDFYEVDYLPEKDNIRYTISPEARKEVLKRLLLLNHERYEEEIKQGLHKEKDAKAFYVQKGIEVPEEVLALYDKTKKKKTATPAKETRIVPGSLPLPIEDTMRPFGLDEGIYTIRDAADIIERPYETVRRWFLKLAQANYEGLDDPAQRDIDQRRISFHGLVELVVIGTLLENKMSIRKIFEARNDLGEKTGKPYPFATNNVTKNLHKAGKVLIYDFLEGHVTLDGSSQLNLTLITDFFEVIEFDSSGIAQRLFPKKGKRKIVIDPAIAGGKPSFKDHRGIRVETIMKFYDGPGSVNDLLENYSISQEEIDAALAYTS